MSDTVQETETVEPADGSGVNSPTPAGDGAATTESTLPPATLANGLPGAT